MIYLFIFWKKQTAHVICMCGAQRLPYIKLALCLCALFWNTTVRVWVGTATRRDFPLSPSKLVFSFLRALCSASASTSRSHRNGSFSSLFLSYQFFLFGWILIDVSIWTRFTFVLGTREIARIVIFRLQVQLSPFFHYFSALSFTCWNYFSACACVVRKPWTCIICNIF